MLLLSVDRINMHSPYTVSVGGVDSIVFTTDDGVQYEVSFVRDYTIEVDNLFQLCLENVNGVPVSRDSKVRDTVFAIIEEFFQRNELCMLYICDVSDGRQAARNRLFCGWFYQYPNKSNYELLPAGIEVDGVAYYASLLLSRSNPEYAAIRKIFIGFETNIHAKWDEASE